MMVVYTILMSFLLLLFLPLAVIAGFLGKKSLWLRLSPPSLKPHEKRIWIHASSVGEAVIAFSTASELRKRYPYSEIVISMFTTSGLNRLHKLNSSDKIIDAAFYAPFDHPLIASMFIRKISPSAFLIVETELWPALLEVLHKYRIPTAIINGRITKKSLKSYRSILPLFKLTTSRLNTVCVQSEIYAERFRRLGTSPDRIIVTGNIKLDSLPEPSRQYASASREKFGIPDTCKVFVAGSVRPGEEEIIIESFAQISSNYHDSFMIIAPRHMNRIHEIEEFLSAKKLAYFRRTSPVQPGGNEKVLILDTIGELLETFKCADVAFVGGSMIDYGGHNPLEPSAFGIPVLFGPYMRQTGSRELLRSGAAQTVHNSSELSEKLILLLNDNDLWNKMSIAGIKTVTDLRGSLSKTIDVLTVNGVLK